MSEYQIVMGFTLGDTQENFLEKFSEQFDYHPHDVLSHIIQNGYYKEFIESEPSNEVLEKITESYFLENSGL